MEQSQFSSETEACFCYCLFPLILCEEGQKKVRQITDMPWRVLFLQMLWLIDEPQGERGPGLEQAHLISSGCLDLFWKDTVMDRANAKSLVLRKPWEMSPDNTWWFCRGLFTASIYWLVSKARFWYPSNNCAPGIPYPSFSRLVFSYTFFFLFLNTAFSLWLYFSHESET